MSMDAKIRLEIQRALMVPLTGMPRVARPYPQGFPHSTPPKKGDDRGKNRIYPLGQVVG